MSDQEGLTKSTQARLDLRKMGIFCEENRKLA
jgi:hypothetical protein